MKYLKKIIFLLNSVILANTETYTAKESVSEVLQHYDADIALLSEYQEYITTYQEYSKYTNICMLISTLLQGIIFLYTVFVFGVIIKEVNTNKWWEKLGAILIQISFWTLLTLLLIVPIIYSGFWINLLCLTVFLFFYSLFVLCAFYMYKKFVLFFFIDPEKGEVKLCEKLPKVKVGTIKFKDIFTTLGFYLIWGIGLNVWLLLSIIPRIITFWEEQEVVIDDINNWVSTSNIMRYILRSINNKFNIFSLPIASTNITLSESIFSLFLSVITVIVVFFIRMNDEGNKN